jgi:3-dehydroquinate dehydratase
MKTKSKKKKERIFWEKGRRKREKEYIQTERRKEEGKKSSNERERRMKEPKKYRKQNHPYDSFDATLLQLIQCHQTTHLLRRIFTLCVRYFSFF